MCMSHTLEKVNEQLHRPSANSVSHPNFLKHLSGLFKLLMFRQNALQINVSLMRIVWN